MSSNKEEAEDLHANPFFNAFLESEHFKVAAKSGYVVCVPARLSLGLTKMNADVIATHVLKASPYFKNEYVTLNGKVVAVRTNDKTILCKTGFPKQRTVPIRYEETYYDDSYDAFKIQHISYPFEGHVPKSYIESIIHAKKGYIDTPVERRTLNEHNELIRKMLGETIANQIAVQCDKFAVTFNSSYVMVKGFIGHTAAKIRSAATQIKSDALQRHQTQPPASSPSTATSASTPTASGSTTPTAVYRTTSDGKPVPLTKNDLSELQLSIECILLTELHKKIFSALCDLYGSEDARTQAIVDTLTAANISMKDVGVRPELSSADVSAAFKKLALLPAALTPLSKCCVLLDVHDCLIASIDENFKALEEDVSLSLKQRENIAKNKVLSADDMLPLMVYLVIRSGVRHLHANAEYLSHFQLDGNDGLNLNHLGVHLANFVGAVRFIDSGALLDSDGKLIPSTAPQTHSNGGVAASSSTAPINPVAIAVTNVNAAAALLPSAKSPNGLDDDSISALGIGSLSLNATANGAVGRRRSHQQLTTGMTAAGISPQPTTPTHHHSSQYWNNNIGNGSLTLPPNSSSVSLSAPNSARLLSSSASLTAPLNHNKSGPNSRDGSRSGSRDGSRSNSPTRSSAVNSSVSGASTNPFDWPDPSPLPSSSSSSKGGGGSGGYAAISRPSRGSSSGSGRTPRPLPPTAANAVSGGASGGSVGGLKSDSKSSTPRNSLSSSTTPQPAIRLSSSSLSKQSTANSSALSKSSTLPAGRLSLSSSGGSSVTAASSSPTNLSIGGGNAVPAIKVLNFSTPVLKKGGTAVGKLPPTLEKEKSPSENDLGDFLAKLRDNDDDVVVGRLG